MSDVEKPMEVLARELSRLGVSWRHRFLCAVFWCRLGYMQTKCSTRFRRDSITTNQSGYHSSEASRCVTFQSLALSSVEPLCKAVTFLKENHGRLICLQNGKVADDSRDDIYPTYSMMSINSVVGPPKKEFPCQKGPPWPTKRPEAATLIVPTILFYSAYPTAATAGVH